MSELRIGVIGVGGRRWLAKHAHQPEQGVRVTAGADPSPKALAEFKNDFGRDAFTADDYRKILDRADVDAVFITSPDFLHAEQALAAIAAGKHIYLEKPMALSIVDTDRILQAAHDKNVKLFVGHNMRYMVPIRKMKELVEQGAIGEVRAAWCRHFIAYGGDAYFREWHAEQKYVNGLFLQKGAHDIDVIHWITGAYTRRVTAFGNLSVYNRCARRQPNEYTRSCKADHWPPLKQTGFSPYMNIEDTSMMLMQMDRGIMGSYQQCHFTPDSCRNQTFIGTEGRMENIGDGPDAVIRVWNQRHGDWGSFQEKGDQDIQLKPDADGSHGGADPQIVAEFVGYIREGGPTSATPGAARYSVAAGCQATLSLRSGGQPLDVPSLEPGLEKYFS